MKFYGIESEGKLRMPIVSTLPVYDYTKHKGTLYYQTSDDSIYQGTGDASGSWVRTGIATLSELPTEESIIKEGLVVYIQETDLLYYRTSDKWIVIIGQIVNDLVLYISTSGNDTDGNGTSSNPWLSINKAFAYLARKSISSNVTVTIQLSDGTYNTTEIQRCDHPNGDRIKITGENSYAKTISAVTASTGTGGDETTATATLTVNNTTNIAVGDYVMIRNMHENSDDFETYTQTGTDFIGSGSIVNLHGRGYCHHLNGVWKVTAVNSSVSISLTTTLYTVASLRLPVTSTTAAFTGDLIVLKSHIICNNVSGIIVDNGNTLGNSTTPGIDKLAMIGKEGDANLSTIRYWEAGAGIAALNNSHIEVGEHVCAFDFWIGFGSTHSGSINCAKTVASGCYRSGYSASYGGTMNCYNSYVSGCNRGITTYVNGTVMANSVGIVNCHSGFYNMFSSTVFSECASIENCYYGFDLRYNSTMTFLIYYISNPNTGIYASFGSSGTLGGSIIDASSYALILSNTTALRYESYYGNYFFKTSFDYGGTTDSNFAFVEKSSYLLFPNGGNFKGTATKANTWFLADYNSLIKIICTSMTLKQEGAYNYTNPVKDSASYLQHGSYIYGSTTIVYN